MTARLIDGTAISAQVREEVREAAQEILNATGQRPGLAVILVGDSAASQVYVRNKIRACEAAGFHSVSEHLPEETTEAAPTGPSLELLTAARELTGGDVVAQGDVVQGAGQQDGQRQHGAADGAADEGTGQIHRRRAITAGTGSWAAGQRKERPHRPRRCAIRSKNR